VLVAGWVGADNLGDELIFRSVQRKLESRGVAVVAVSVDPSATHRLHGVETVSFRDLPGTMRAIRSSQGMIFGPGGLIQDETSIWNLPAHLHRVVAARALGTPVLGMGLGAGPLDSRLGRALVRSGLRSVTMTVRDTASAALVERCGAGPATVTADVAFGLPLPTSDAEERIVASLRPFSGGGGVLPARQSDLRAIRDEPRVIAAARALDGLSERTGLPIHLLAFEPERDTAFHGRIAEHMRSGPTTGIAHIDSVFDEMARSRLVVGMRYHAVVAAVMAGRPSVIIGYSPKTASIADSLGDGCLFVPNEVAAYGAIAEGASLLGRDGDVELVRGRFRWAEAGNDAALDAFLTALPR
jgi:polysaccharide pyruvyl transferase CsaB